CPHRSGFLCEPGIDYKWGEGLAGKPDERTVGLFTDQNHTLPGRKGESFAVAAPGGGGMNSLPVWLPPMAPVNPWTADTFGELYGIFKRDFKDSQPVYAGRPVWFFPEMEDGKEVIFWHLTSEKHRQTGERMPDLRRSERLPWARPMIDKSSQPEILAFDYLESG